jgi:hypothetical protein
MSDDPNDDEPRGRLDTVAYLYILLGVPALVGFLVVLFTLVNFIPSIPA